MVTHYHQPGDDMSPRRGVVADEALRQLAHASYHAWRPTGWVVGVRALDGVDRHLRTEDVTTLFGLPVTRSLDLPADAIRLTHNTP